MSTFQPQQQQPQIQTQPQPDQQQPVVVYPNPGTKQPVPDPSHHSNGSFGTVFIVLAIVVVVSAIACLLGRLCNRKAHQNHKPSKQKQSKHSRTAPKEVRPDLEFGNMNNSSRTRDNIPGDHNLEFGNINHNNPNSRPREGGADIEFGFDSKRPSSGPNGVIKTNGIRENRGHVVFENINGEVKHHGGDHHHHDGRPRSANHG